ncbi:unnamed protein product, partial [Coccothraustes coccothraustes]
GGEHSLLLVKSRWGAVAETKWWGLWCRRSFREELDDDVVVSLTSGPPDLFTLLS